MDILAEGYLVRKHGIDPSTGESWKPAWVFKHDCNEETVVRWDSRSTVQRCPSMDTPIDDVDDHKNDSLSFCSDPEPSRKRSITDLADVKTESGALELVVPKRPKFTGFSARPPSYGPLQTGFKSSRKHTFTNMRGSSAVGGPASSSVISTSLTTVSHTEIDALPTDVTHGWLLRDLPRTKGMVVEVRQSFADNDSSGWCGGDFEGIQGVIQGVLNVRNDTRLSTATVKLRDPLDDSDKVYAIPVKYLWPVPPSHAGQNVIILIGSFRGKEARLRQLEDGSANNWLVSAGNHHFEIEAEHMVRLHESI